MKRLAAGFLIIATPAQAQTLSDWSLAKAIDAPEALMLSGSIRLRYETIWGQPRVGFNSADDLVNLRTTLFAEYDTGPVRIGAELYDSRVYAANARTPVSTNEVNTFEFVQAYAALDIDRPFGGGTNATLQAGRFLLNLGSRRLVAADDYRNTTNAYTGLRGDASFGGGVKATLIYTLPQVRLPDDLPSLLDNEARFDRESSDLVLWGGVLSKAKAIGRSTAELSYFGLHERDAPGRPTRNRSLHTLAMRLIADPAPGRFDHEVEIIRQFGTVRASNAASAALLDVSAWFVHADAGYGFRGGWTPRVSLEFDYASGDKGGGTFNRFDTLFGMRRADLAPAGLYNAIGRANILTPALRIEANPNKRTDWFVNHRLMWLASRTDAFSTTAVRDASGRSGSFAGQQSEARVRYWLIPDTLRTEINGVWLHKGRFLKTAPNAPRNGDTLYVSLNLTAIF